MIKFFLSPTTLLYPTTLSITYREYTDPHLIESSRRETLVETAHGVAITYHTHSSICIAVVMRAQWGSRRAKYSLLSLTNWLADRSADEVDNTTILATNVLHGHTRVSSWSDWQRRRETRRERQACSRDSDGKRFARGKKRDLSGINLW